MKRQLLVLLAALALAGCNSVTRDIAFDGKSEAAFALLAADGMPVTGSQSFQFFFQKVDLSTSTFSKDGFSILFDGMGTIGGDEFSKPDHLKTTLRYGGKAVPAGDYALFSRNDYASYGMSNSTLVNCYSLGSLVLRLRPGTINIIAVGSVRDRATVEPLKIDSQVTDVLAGYHNMSAPTALAVPIGSLSFETKRNIFGSEICQSAGAFHFIPR